MFDESKLTIKCLPHGKVLGNIEIIVQTNLFGALIRTTDGQIFSSLRRDTDMSKYGARMPALRQIYADLAGVSLRELDAAVRRRRAKVAKREKAEQVDSLRKGAAAYGYELVPIGGRDK